MRLRGTVQALGALGVCGAIGVCTLYVTKSTAQSAGDGQTQAASNASPIYGITIPAGYRDWRLISVDHLAGSNLKQLRAQLGNDIAIKAFREGTLPFPDGAIIAALHWNEASSDENNKVLASGFPGAGLAIFRCRVRRECSVHGQGLKKVRRVRRLGIRRLHERQTRQRGAAPDLLPLPSACERSRLRFYSLRTYALNFPATLASEIQGFGDRCIMQSSHRMICDRMVAVLPASPSPFSGPTI